MPDIGAVRMQQIDMLLAADTAIFLPRVMITRRDGRRRLGRKGHFQAADYHFSIVSLEEMPRRRRM